MDCNPASQMVPVGEMKSDPADFSMSSMSGKLMPSKSSPDLKLRQYHTMSVKNIRKQTLASPEP